MFEDRLGNALDAIKNEPFSDAELARAHDSVLQRLATPAEALCMRFRAQFNDYLESRLADGRRMLLEDHLSRCSGCRGKLIELRGDQVVATMPPCSKSRIRQWTSWAAVAAVLCAVLYVGWGFADAALVWGPRATVETVEGNLYLVSRESLEPGAKIGQNQAVRTGVGSRAVLRLADGSLVEVSERTELSIHAALSGKAVRLHSGNILIRAAKQGRFSGLRVETRDSVASVKGTVFAVSTGLAGSRVAVIEGSVVVAQRGEEATLTPGQQTASNPALSSSINEMIAWSGNADEYLSILASLYEIEQELAAFSAKPMRTQSALFDILPPGTFIYGAIPNIGGKLEQAAELIKRQSGENPVFGAWWDSADGRSLNQLLGRIYIVAHLLGDEVVVGFSGSSDVMSFILAEIQPGKREELAFALDVAAGDHIGGLSISLTDSLIMISDSEKNLARLNANLGRGEQTPFIDEIRARYDRGTDWLFAIDVEAIGNEAVKALHAATDVGQDRADRRDNNDAIDNRLKYVFLEQRSPYGVEENGLMLAFNGHRTGPASFLADSGSVGAAEYLPSGVLAAGFVSTREPKQMLDEMIALFGNAGFLFTQENAGGHNVSEKNFASNIQLATYFAPMLGTEFAFGIEGISLSSGPVWTLTAQIYDTAEFDKAVQRLLHDINALAGLAGHGDYMVVEESVIDGRAWHSLKFTKNPLAITWTYDRDYIVLASDRGAALRAIAAKNSGGALVWASEFQQQISVSSGINPSAFLWINTRGILADLAELSANPAFSRLMAQRDPALVVFTATPERIHATGRVRISGIIMDLMLMQGSGFTTTTSY